MNIIKKTSCIVVADGSLIVGSFTGPDAERHAEIFVAAIDATQPHKQQANAPIYVFFASNGNIRLFTQSKKQADEFAFDNDQQPIVYTAEPDQPVALSMLTDERLDSIVEGSGGHWAEDEFRIDGKGLADMLRLAASAPAQQAEESQYRDNNWWLGWNAAIRSMRAAPSHDDLLAKISDAWTNYERMGEVCQFEGQPMIYASTLEEIHDAALSGTGSDESKKGDV